jgi:hypothetical protein
MMSERDAVDTKYHVDDAFGNDAAGFIRVRKRKLNGGGPDRLPIYRKRALESVSFDLVRAVRVNGKPRHKFVLGLGSLKDERERDLMQFWVHAIGRMCRHGLKPAQRRRLADEMIRKGAPLPTAKQCNEFRDGWRGERCQAQVDEITAWLAAH